MQKLLLAAALLAVGYFAYDEFAGPRAGGFRTSSGSGGLTGFSGAPRSIAGGVTGAAGRIAN